MKGRSTRISRKLAVSAASLVALVIASAVMANGVPRFSLAGGQRAAAQQNTATPTPAATPTPTVTPGGYCELWVDKWESPDPVSEGGQIAYSIEVDNDGDGACSDLTVVDTIPDGTDCVSASVDIDSDIPPNSFNIEGCDTSGTVEWTTTADLDRWDYVTFEMVVQLTLDAEDGDHITNEACATSTSDTGGDCDAAQTTVGTAGSISGRVTDTEGIPLEYCEVEADSWDGGGDSGDEETDQDGYYLIAGLAADDYLVRVWCNGYLEEYYNGARSEDDAIPVVVVGGHDTPGIDFALSSGGTITGFVRDADDVPIAGASVVAELVGGDWWQWSSTSANEDGSYSIATLAGGDYRVSAGATGYAFQYYAGSNWQEEATPVSVNEGSTTSGIDFVLHTGGSISGTVTDSNGSPIEGATIWCEPIGHQVLWWWMYDRMATSALDGSYTTADWPDGEYRCWASADGYFQEYYDGARESNDATAVTVTAGENNTGIDFALDRGAIITGRVTDASSGLPIPDVDVYASGTHAGESAYTDANGNYVIGEEYAIPSDCYVVDAGRAGYVREYYDGVRDYDSATAVCVSEGETVSGIDFALDVGGTISGVVTDSGGHPLHNCSVFADPWDGGGGWGLGHTHEDGTYTANGLATGDYRVYVHCEGYVLEYYNNVRNRDHATPVNVVEGQEHGGINFILDVGGTISGTVTDAAGHPLEDCDLEGYPLSGSGSSPSGYTDVHGSYTITGLATSNYRVQAWCDGYVPEYYNGVYDADYAVPVSVVEGVITPNINFTLDPEGTISGDVEDTNGDPIADARVCADSGDVGNCDWTDDDGSYTIDELAGGEYIVDANASADGYITEYYQGARTSDDATPVSVTEGEDTPGIDFVLDIGGTVSALITDVGGNPIQGAWALASPSLTAFTNAISPPNIPEDGGICWRVASGECTIRGLATGNYIISASAPNYLTSYFNGATSEGDADPVLVTEGEDTQVELTLDPVGCGDGNEDRRTSMVDAMLIAQYVAGLIEGGDLNLTMTDVNGNGSVSMVDAMMVAQKVAGLIPNLSCNLPVVTPTATATPGP